MRSSLLVFALLVTLRVKAAHAEPPPRKPTNATAVDRYAHATRLFGNAAFAEAIEEFKSSALVEPSPATDFNLGVCYRLLGERATDASTQKPYYENAIWHYERFIKASPETPDRAAEVQKLVDKMRAEIAAMPMSASTSPPSAPLPSESTAPTRARAPFYRDPIAWALTGSGAVTLGVAGGLFWSASSLRDDANASPDQAEQTELRDRARTRSLVGTTLAVVGGGLLVSGVIKLIAHDTDTHSQKSASLGLGVTINELVVFGRF